MERLTIKNFAGLQNLDVELNVINIFIGKQASGKSVTAKLIYFFKGIPREIVKGVYDKKSKSDISNILKKKFLTYFPTHTWGQNKFEISFFFENHYINIIENENASIKIQYSDIFTKIFSAGKKILKKEDFAIKSDESTDIYSIRLRYESKYFDYIGSVLGEGSKSFQTFIPAGRSFFANLQNSIFTFLSNSNSLDPFLVEFGSFYETVKEVSSRRNIRDNKSKESFANLLCQDIMGGEYLRENNKDFLIHSDKRRINVAYSSSGQQETLPLLLILLSFERLIIRPRGTTLYIEEPEAHLFPEAQKKMVELITYISNTSRTPLNIVITTHSPYILSSFNNLLEAGIIYSESDQKEKVHKIINKNLLIPKNALNAYSMQNGSSKSIIDKDSLLVNSEYLDSVSEEISTQFNDLLDLL